MKDELLPYKIGLTLIPGVGGVIARRLIAFCGGVEAVYSEKRRAIMKIPGIGQTIADAIYSNNILEKGRKEAAFVEKRGIKAVFYLDKDYPHRLKSCADSPLLIYTKGNVDFENSRVLAVVGTRNATGYGREVTEAVIKGMAVFNVLIVSGLAYGVDTWAHRFAMEYNLPTIAVLGHGLDRIYPYANTSLAKKMLANGGVVSDFPSNTKPDRENFPKRNRIIAGLADAVLVVEASYKGGALITADIANSYNRDVFAVPGRSGDKFSNGCNWLIKTNRAALIESADDIIYNMGWDEVKSAGRSVQYELHFDLCDEEKKIVEFLSEHTNAGIDEICNSTTLSQGKVSECLLKLEFQGIVSCLPGKMFRLVS